MADISQLLTPPQQDPQGLGTAFAGQGEMKPYTPSWSEWLGGKAQDMMAGAPLSYAQEFGRRAQQVAGVIPGLGQALAANQAYRDYQGGNYVGAALNTVGALPFPAPEAKIAAEATEPAAQQLAKTLTAYHGSPHSFDQFSTAKLGSGEGAQAYGHGLYFAENEKVAQSYRDKLASGGKGSMYEVSINADPEHFLDWDKPLAAQSDHVKSVVGSFGIKNPDLTGAQIYRMRNIAPGPGTGANKIMAAQALRDAGIPGIKFLDQNSRVAGEGTSNYTVFDDKNIDILRRYGLPGLGLATGAAALTGGQPQAEAQTVGNLPTSY